MKASIHDVAREAQVSISTISRVLNATGPVSEETRLRVLRAAKQLGYVPNVSARSLKISQSHTIGLLVRSIANPFFAPMIHEIKRQLNLRGYPFLVEPVEDGQDELTKAASLAAEKKLCGLILIGGQYDHTEQQFLQLAGVPSILLTFTAPDAPGQLYSSVIIDDVQEAQKAVEYLISLGHRDICFLAKLPNSPNTTGYRRMLGYRAALEAHDIPFRPQLVQDCEYTATSGFAATRALQMRGVPFTAAFAASDTIATGVAKAVLISGQRIPEDISIVGFDGIEAAEYYHPALDTIAQPAVEMASAGLGLLFEQMQDGRTDHLVFEATLIKRGSARRIEA